MLCSGKTVGVEKMKSLHDHEDEEQAMKLARE